MSDPPARDALATLAVRAAAQRRRRWRRLVLVGAGIALAALAAVVGWRALRSDAPPPPRAASDVLRRSADAPASATAAATRSRDVASGAPGAARPGAERSAALRPGRDSFARESDGTYSIDPGDEDWRRTGLFGTEPLAPPVAARFVVEAQATRDAAAGVLAEQGFDAPAGFVHEVGLRGDAREVEAGADLEGFAAWLTLLADRRGDAHGLFRVIGPDQRRGQLARGAPGVAVVDELTLPGAFADGPVEVVVEVGSAGVGLTVRPARGLPRVRRFPWSELPLGAEEAGRGPLHAWAHSGNWATGRGRGSVTAFTADGAAP